MRERMRHPAVVVPIVLLVLIVAVAGLVRGQNDDCPGRAVFHLPAGTCMNPSSLEVDGERNRVEAAIFPYGGTILYTTFGSHHVRFPVDDIDALDRIKDELTEAGFEVRYTLVLELP